MDDIKKGIQGGDIDFFEYEDLIDSHLKDIICMPRRYDFFPRSDSCYISYLISIHPDKFEARMMLRDFTRVGNKVMGKNWLRALSAITEPTMRGAIESENIGILEYLLTFADEHLMIETIRKSKHGSSGDSKLQRWFYDKFPEYPTIV